VKTVAPFAFFVALRETYQLYINLQFRKYACPIASWQQLPLPKTTP
jgi:hypothetical protein